MRKTSQLTKEPFLAHLGDLIRDRRVALLMSQAELGDLCNLHRTYITGIENGLRNVSILTLLRITNALSVPLSSPILAAEKLMERDKTRGRK